jgi:hypothetical protein
MKKLCYVLMVGTLCLSACKKKYCWTCTTETTGVSSTPETTTAEYCDYTEDDIKAKEGTVNTTTTVGTKPTAVTQTTTCAKKSK